SAGLLFFFFQAEVGIRDFHVTGVQTCALPISVLFLLFFNAFAWGPTGHRVTGWIAEKYLSKKAKKQIERVLKGHSLAMVSTWMEIGRASCRERVVIRVDSSE